MVADLMTKYGVTLSRVELARLAGVSVQRTAVGGYTSSTVGHWLDGRHNMPLSLYDLVRTKLWLIARGLSTKQEMLDGMAYETLDQKLTPAETLR
jgi:hypothetical protein